MKMNSKFELLLSARCRNALIFLNSRSWNKRDLFLKTRWNTRTESFRCKNQVNGRHFVGRTGIAKLSLAERACDLIKSLATQWIKERGREVSRANEALLRGLSSFDAQKRLFFEKTMWQIDFKFLYVYFVFWTTYKIKIFKNINLKKYKIVTMTFLKKACFFANLTQNDPKRK